MQAMSNFKCWQEILNKGTLANVSNITWCGTTAVEVAALNAAEVDGGVCAA
jgi:hypothetical protein